jgi:hypothetical protein
MYAIFMRLIFRVALMGFTDNEFTQLMKGLQGERLRQAFRYFDENQDGFIRPDQFKRIILVRLPPQVSLLVCNNSEFCFAGACWA